jgi:hypothetical protein
MAFSRGINDPEKSLRVKREQTVEKRVLSSFPTANTSQLGVYRRLRHVGFKLLKWPRAPSPNRQPIWGVPSINSRKTSR